MDFKDNIADDGAFVPRLTGDGHPDLSFERLLFSTFPTVLLIALFPFHLRYYYRQPARVFSRRLLWTKLSAAACLTVVELFHHHVLRSTAAVRTERAESISVLACVACLCISVIVYAEHRRALQSSALAGVYLLITMLSDTARAASYFVRLQSHPLTSLAISSVTLRFGLLLLLELPKRSHTTDQEEREQSNEQTATGFWSRSFNLWLYSTFSLGFRKIISIEDLGSLGPEFSSQRLSEQLALALNESKSSRYCLIKACVRIFYGDLFLVVIPRLCFAGFVFCQPIFLQQVITYVGREDSSKLIIVALLAACVAVFFGIAATRSIYNQMNSRLVTMVRGSILPLITKKTLMLPSSIVSDSAATTLMSTDIETITAGIPEIHEIWGSYFEIGLGLYLLHSLIGDSAFAVVVPVVAASIFSYGVGKLSTMASAAWNKSIEKRVAQTTKALSQIRSIKMIGLEKPTTEQLQNLRAKETTAFKRVRALGTVMSVVSQATYASIHITALTGSLFGSSFAGLIAPSKAFTIMAIATLTAYPLMDVFNSYPRLERTLASFRRVQAYLLTQEVHIIPGPNENVSQPLRARLPEPEVVGRNIELVGAYLAPSESAEPVLNNVSCALNSSQTTAVIGPVASGKTTLLRAMLGEAAVHYGQLRRKRCTVAYCGQRPWLRNASIRRNIIGPSTFDPVWYEVIVHACALNEDLQQLPDRDLTIVGSNGGNLSGGQMHRIALARALYLRAEVILMDDIFGGLDEAMAQVIHSRLFGAKGVLQRSTSTVVFATHSVSFIKAAHQALILDGSGNIQVHSDPSKIAFSDGFTARLEQPNTEAATVPAASPAQGGNATPPPHGAVRQRGDMSLYRYFVGPTSSWKLAIAFVFVALLVASERFPEVFIRVWLETDASNNDYYQLYIASGAAGSVAALFTMWYCFMKLAPENSLKMHKALLDTVISAKLSFLASTSTGSILNIFSQDMTLLTEDLPRALYFVTYYGIYTVLDTGIIVSGIQHPIPTALILFGLVYSVQHYYLRTARQVRHLEAEAKTPLYTFFTEMSEGLEHVRAFGWQSNLVNEGLQALDNSQKPYYFKFAIQRWLELAVDCINLALAIALVLFATVSKKTTTQPAVGLSMLGLVTLSDKLKLAVGSWVTLETALGGVARLRTFMYETPAEERTAREGLPERWPDAGRVSFSNVTSRYNRTDTTPVLDDVSLTIQGGQKVGISGRSGSGKTSMLLTMLRLMDYTGTIEIDGIDIATIPPQLLRSRITTVSQDSIKLDGSIRENILPFENQLQDETITEHIIFEALDQVELTEVIDNRGGLDAKLSGMDFSEGQMQLLGLARAIVHNTCTQSRVVILDEATSNLDLETDSKIQAAIRDAFLDCTIFMVSHRSESLWDSNVRLDVRNKAIVRLAPQRRLQLSR